jgi:DNA-binding transcriptional LysR family regulator
VEQLQGAKSLTIQQLKFFCEVCDCGSIAAAAGRLFITPSGLSMALQRMEKELSCKLLVRSSRGVHPTPEGEFLWSHAREILAHTTAYEEFFDTQVSHTEQAVLALATNIPDEVIGDLVLKFNRLSSKRRVVLKEYPSPLCDMAVENHEAELGFNTSPFDKNIFDCIPIMACPLYLLVNRSHMYAALDVIPTSYLQGMNLVIRESKMPYQSEFFIRCREKGVQPYIVHETGNSLMVYNMVHRDSQCFGLIPKSAADMINLPNVVAIPFEDPGFVRTLFMFKNRNTPISPVAREWEDFVLHYISSADNNQKSPDLPDPTESKKEIV